MKNVKIFFYVFMISSAITASDEEDYCMLFERCKYQDVPTLSNVFKFFKNKKTKILYEELVKPSKDLQGTQAIASNKPSEQLNAKEALIEIEVNKKPHHNEFANGGLKKSESKDEDIEITFQHYGLSGKAIAIGSGVVVIGGLLYCIIKNK